MLTNRRFSIALLVLLVATASAAVTHARVSGDEWWSPGISPTGVEGRVRAMVEWDRFVVIGGTFSAVRNQPAANVALLTTAATGGAVTGWGQAGAGLDGTVYDLILHDGEVVAVGYFDGSGGASVGNVARFDGTAWHPLGGGIPGSGAVCVASYGGDLYVENYRWDGSAWTEIFPTNGHVNHLVVQDGLLFVAGSFTEARGEPHNRVFAWDGTATIALAGGLPWSPQQATAGPAGPVFSGQAPTYYHEIIAWNGTAWVLEHSLAGTVWALGLHAGDLYASSFVPDGPHRARPALFTDDGGYWHEVAGVDVTAFHSRSDHLLLGTTTGSAAWPLVTPGLAAWSGGALGEVFTTDGFTGGFAAIADWNGSLIAGGRFQLAGGTPSRGFASHAGATWTAWGDPAALGFGAGSFSELAATGPTVFGVFEYIDWDITARVLARLAWDGAAFSWQPADPGGDWHWGQLQAVGTTVYSVRSDLQVVAPDGVVTDVPGLDLDAWVRATCASGSDLVVAGDFTMNQGQPVANVLRFDGAGWTGVAGGISATGRVDAIAALDGARLAAAGREDGGAYRVWVFDGVAWEMLPGEFDAGIGALAWHEGHLFAGGSFRRIGPTWAPGIAVWSGDSWLPVGTGLTRSSQRPSVRDLLTTADGLFVVGTFDFAGGRPAPGLAAWMGDPALLTGAPTHVADRTPAAWARLAPAAPNPFNPRTSLAFDVAAPGRVRISVWDVRGRRVRDLVDAEFAPGHYTAQWDGRTATGRDAPSGVYFTRLEFEGQTASVKMTLVR